ncbi:MAG: hypothetical protein DWQ06_11770 [Calditrichaeota bacterium]|nr:MAG: hypothetical protein DWQ06_11770 [Calditrichota bacterium]
MYLRYRAKYYNETTEQLEFGFFWAAEYLKNYGNLDIDDRQKLEELIHWFDNNLPIPDYYQKKKNRQDAKSATSWFKDSSNNFIARMNELSEILKNYNVEVERISSKKLLGKQIYEDEFQVTILPYREVAKKIK